MADKTKSVSSRSESPLKRVCAIHDLSCFGRCALTVILPTLSAMGIQAIPLPTALLSTHTGGFYDMHFRDLTDDMKKISEHFSSLGLTFDAIYPGFLGDERQIEEVCDFIDKLGDSDTLIFVDPVMGDDGVLYSTYTDELVRGMRRLCRKAHIITPNLTEAFFLTEREFIDTSTLSRSEALDVIHSLLPRLCDFGCKQIVITGIPYENNNFATYGYDCEKNEEYFYSSHKIGLGFPGTGDLFASVMLGMLLDTNKFYSSLVYASDFVARVMEYSAKFPTPLREGVAFERFLGELAEKSDRK